jgi:putative heme utilization carrier protein HutX
MTAALLDDLSTYMRENPGAVIEDVARDRKVTPRAVIEALPVEMVKIGGGADAFVVAMQDIATWGVVTLIVHTEDGIFEVTDPVAPGSVGRGYFNLSHPTGLHGHLRHDRCAGVAFVERPFMGKSSAFVAFLNVDGGVMFKVFVGRDESRALRQDQMERFRQLSAKICGAAAA